MKKIAQWISIFALASTYCVVAVAVLHPHVSREYREYFIDRTSTDYNPERYPGTPEEGMLFGRNGLPVWVSSTHGLSIRGDAGRYTQADRSNPAGLTFTQGFNGDVCLDFIASPVRWLVDKKIDVLFGEEVHPVGINVGQSEYRLHFKLHDADRLDFLLPPELPRVIEEKPDNADPRRLGILLYRLRILPGECSSAANNRPWQEPQK
jgi:hypothetical protein